jgi:hypothetical protein
MLIESSKPLTVLLRSGEVKLMPGQPVEFSEEEALRLLARAKGKVRLVASSDSMTVESANAQARPVYFERNEGVIYGPARVSDLAKTGIGATERFWVIVEHEGQVIWVWSDRLRSKKAFDQQVMPKTIVLIKERK